MSEAVDTAAGLGRVELPLMNHREQTKRPGDMRVFRLDGTVQILVEAESAVILYQAIRKAGLIVAPPAEPDHDALVDEFGYAPGAGQQCLVVSDPDHLIADVLARWRRQQGC